MPSPRYPFRHARLLSLTLALSLVLTGGTALAIAPAPPAHAAVSISGMSVAQVQKLIFDQVNAQRTKAGVKPLTMNSGINSVATKWSGKQAAAKKMSHNPNYSSQIPSGWRAAGENVAAGYAPTAVVGAWMKSEGHRKNILSTSYTHIGIGVALDSDGRAYYTQNFAGYSKAPAGTNTKPSSTTAGPCTAPTSGVSSASGIYIIATSTTTTRASITSRVAPSTSCATGASKIVYGTKITRVSTYGSFTKVKVGSKTWWVKSTDIRRSPVRYAAGVLPLRAEPSASAASVITVPKHTKLQFLASSGSWRKVVATGGTGWVPAASLLTADEIGK
ncbi:CAP domain-containing protein [Microbacterium terricola]|uniref:CAP domain-containing protein n=1 Tax=Microbacterium terricola TaxID=344163 RepID=UPI0021E7A2C6|nr:CAP domain-containing protein [Microbacterium terricola]UYK41039.1 CAP domain-containing protein [Microbacterium terricola]